MRSSWINKTDNTVSLKLSEILFWVIQAESYEHAVALSMSWNSGKMKHPYGQGSKVL